jgi:hypothetical protein
MRQRLRSTLTYANVMATLAVFIAVGGTATAAVIITSNSQVAQGTISGHKPPSGKHPNIIAGSVNGTDVASNSLGGARIAESSLGKVPSAASADSVGGKSAADLEGARAYALVRGSTCGPPLSFCPLLRNKRVAYAAHVDTGVFCVGVNGISATDPTSLAIVTQAFDIPSAWTSWAGGSGGNVDCVPSEFEINTGAGGPSQDRSFIIVIP